MRAWGRVRAVLLVIGAVIASYLTVAHYLTALPIVCPAVSVIDCHAVLSSPQSEWFGFPVAAYGVAWFFGGWVVARRRAIWRGIWLATGVLAALWLLYQEFWVIGAICLWCTAIHAIILLVFVGEMVAPPRRPVPGSKGS